MNTYPTQTRARRRWHFQMPGDTRSHWHHDLQTVTVQRRGRLILARRLCHECRLIVGEWTVCASRKLGGEPCNARVLPNRHLCGVHWNQARRSDQQAGQQKESAA